MITERLERLRPAAWLRIINPAGDTFFPLASVEFCIDPGREELDRHARQEWLEFRRRNLNNSESRNDET